MAVDISQETQAIRTAVFAKDVRDSIANGLDTMASEMNTYEEDLSSQQDSVTERQTNLENQFTQQISNNISSHPSSAETVAARTSGVTGTTYTNIGLRMDNTDSQLAEIAINVKSFGAKGDGVTDDTQAIENALVSLVSNGGGKLYFPSGTYKYSTLSIDTNTNPNMHPICICGAGMGTTTLLPSEDGVVIQSYLVTIKKLCIVGTNSGTYCGIKGIPMSNTGDAVIGRTYIKEVQITQFYNGIDTKHFDQLWIEKCNVSSNLNYGIYIEPTSGAALLEIKDCITNNNTSHGIYIYSTSIIALIKMVNDEAVANGGNGIRIEGSSTNTINSVILENIDIEQVSGINNTALYLKNVWRFNIISGAYQPSSGQTIFSSITLNACKQGFINNPWWRSVDLGSGTSVTNYLYVTGGAEQIYLLGSSYFGTPVDFTIDTATTNTSSCINLDLIYTDRISKEFVPANELYAIQGTPAPTISPVNETNVWKFDVKANVSVSQAVAIAIKPYIRQIKSVDIYWWNDTSNTGSVSWTLALNSYVVGNTSATTQYVANSSSANSQYVLQKTTINTPNWAKSDISNLWVIRNTNDSNDTLNGMADLVGIQFNFQ